MKRQSSINEILVTNFLRSGALCRRPSSDHSSKQSRWIIMAGPFSAVRIEENPLVSIHCPLFSMTNSEGALVPSQWVESSGSEILAWLDQIPTSETPPAGPWSEPRLESFVKDFEFIQQAIDSQEIQKAVPVVFAKAKGPVLTDQKVRTLKALLRASSNLFPYGYWGEDEGILGATPEELFRLDLQTMQGTTMALAGTLPKQPDLSASELLKFKNQLMGDLKEQAEHDFVCQYLENRLLNLGTVHRQSREVLELPHLLHLMTRFEFHIQKKISYLELIKMLHPTPALGVSGKDLTWMKQLQHFNERKRFGAPWTFQIENQVQCLVAIRNIQWDSQQSQIGSGCGIVSASEVQKEWIELAKKRDSVFKILDIDRSIDHKNSEDKNEK